MSNRRAGREVGSLTVFIVYLQASFNSRTTVWRASEGTDPDNRAQRRYTSVYIQLSCTRRLLV